MEDNLEGKVVGSETGGGIVAAIEDATVDGSLSGSGEDDEVASLISPGGAGSGKTGKSAGKGTKRDVPKSDGVSTRNAKKSK